MAKSYNGVGHSVEIPSGRMFRKLSTRKADQSRYNRALVMARHADPASAAFTCRTQPCAGQKFDYKLEWMEP